MKKLLLYSCLAISPAMFAQVVTNDTFNFTGSMQTFSVPACVTSVTITCYGAQGGNAVVGGTGGLGGMATGVLNVTTGQSLYVYVGGQNGYNGGGTGGLDGSTTVYGGPSTGIAPNGGGGSDVRVGGTAIGDRIIVAGGGGAGGNNGVWTGCQVAGPAGNGGDGGGLTGNAGTYGVGTPCNCGGGGGEGGQGGTQSAGGLHGNYSGSTACLRSSWTAGQDGTLFQGGAGSTTWHNGTGGGGGGGGGYYGGGSGGSGSDTTPGGGGGGGSSWTGTLTSASTTAGIRNGNGMIVISYSTSASLPTAPTNINGAVVCPGATAAYTCAPVAGATSYTWTVPAGWSVVSGQGTNSVNIQVGATTDTVWVYATNACGNGPASYVVASVNPSPVVNLGPDTANCGPVVLTASGGMTYLWCSGQTVASITAMSTGQYCVTISDANGCTDSDSINVTVNANPTVVASASMNFVCLDDDTVQLFGSPSGGTFTGPGVIPGDQFDPVAAGAGTHNVVYSYTDVNGCTGMDTITITVDLCLGMNAENAVVFAVNPNPASASCMITFASAQSNVQFEITDVQGRVVKSQKESSVNAGTPVVIDLNGIAPGVYMLNVISENGKSIQKLQIQ